VVSIRLFVVVGQARAACSHLRELHRGRLHVGDDLGLAGRIGLPLRGLAAQFGAIVLDTQKEVPGRRAVPFQALEVPLPDTSRGWLKPTLVRT